MRGFIGCGQRRLVILGFYCKIRVIDFEYLIAGPDGEPRRTIPARLKTLNALRADGLITEDEYQELRLKLLSEI